MPGLKSFLLIGCFVFIGGCAVPVIKQDGKVFGIYTPKTAWGKAGLKMAESPEGRQQLLGYASKACTAIGLLTAGACPAAASVAARINDARNYIADYKGERDQTYDAYFALANTFPGAASEAELTEAMELADRVAIEEAAKS